MTEPSADYSTWILRLVLGFRLLGGHPGCWWCFYDSPIFILWQKRRDPPVWSVLSHRRGIQGERLQEMIVLCGRELRHREWKSGGYLTHPWLVFGCRVGLLLALWKTLKQRCECVCVSWITCNFFVGQPCPQWWRNLLPVPDKGRTQEIVRVNVGLSTGGGRMRVWGTFGIWCS